MSNRLFFANFNENYKNSKEIVDSMDILRLPEAAKFLSQAKEILENVDRSNTTAYQRMYKETCELDARFQLIVKEKEEKLKQDFKIYYNLFKKQMALTQVLPKLEELSKDYLSLREIGFYHKPIEKYISQKEYHDLIQNWACSLQNQTLEELVGEEDYLRSLRKIHALAKRYDFYPLKNAIKERKREERLNRKEERQKIKEERLRQKEERIKRRAEMETELEEESSLLPYAALAAAVIYYLFFT